MSDSHGTKRPLDSFITDSSSNRFKRPNPVASDTFVTIHEHDASSNSNRATGSRRPVNFQSLDQYTRHKLLINYYVLTHPDKVAETFTRDRSRDKTEFSVLLENHQFIWSEEDLTSSTLTWGQRVAKKYYEKLFKEYCIIDLSRYAENKFGMRWRTESEVIEGKGQFNCGAKRCSVRGGLTSWEVLFTYMEHNEKKSAMIKVRLCPECSDKLNHHHVHKRAKVKINKSKRNKCKKSHENTNSTSNTIDSVMIKEEILTDTEGGTIESDRTNNDNQQLQQKDSNSKEHQDLIDQIWKQPVKLDLEENETTLEEEVDDYLNQFLL